jgi:ribonuclease E
MMIPNPHLETPNYSINRLRHDDMTDEVLQASYKLVEKPAEEKPLTPGQEQQKAARATAVVQGITPAQPAPVKAEEPKSKTSLLGKFFGWFKALGAEEEQPKAKPAASKSRSQPRRERGEGRGERGERSERGEGGKRRERGERGERGEGRRERGEKPAPAEAKTQEPRQQGEREPRQPKQPRPPRAAPPVQQAEEKPALESHIAAPAIEQGEEAAVREGGRRRGRRGGRRERERREVMQNGEAPAGNVEAVAGQAAPAAPEKLKPSEYIAYPEGYVPPQKPTEYTAYPEGHAPAAEAPVTEAPVSQPVAEAAPAPAAAPATAASSEGLIQIETDSSKVSAAAQSIPGSTEPAPRRRQRQREVYVENEPLVQIETQRPQA